MTLGLIADIGATNARFALAEDGVFRELKIYPCADHASPAAAAAVYLKETGAVPQNGVFSIAASLDGTDMVRMTNHPWDFSIRETAAVLGLKNLKAINDFTSIALSVPHLTGDDLRKVGNGRREKGAPIAIIGPGTGLGAAGIVFDLDNRPVVVTTEGGHVTVPAQTAREFAVIEWLLKNKYSHISAERLVSGKGIVNLYNAICGLEAQPPRHDDAAEIMAEGLAKKCGICVEAIDLFCSWLGAVAGNQALTFGAFGGVYIAGGIVPQMGEAFAASRFRDSFLAKGRYRSYLDDIATLVIMHPQPGLAGLARYLAV